MANYEMLDPLDPITDTGAEKRSRVGLILAAIGAMAVVVLALYLLLGIRSYWIPSESMAPTVPSDSRVLTWDLGSTNRGDIVVFDKPDGLPGQTTDLMHRVVGLGGETISFEDGKVFIDGDLLDEPYLPPDMTTGAGQEGAPAEVVIPDGHVFVMGDNRNRSFDSRSYGSIPESSISANNIWVWSAGDP